MLIKTKEKKSNEDDTHAVVNENYFITIFFFVVYTLVYQIYNDLEILGWCTYFKAVKDKL